MIELLERADPARGIAGNEARIRALVDEKTGMSASVRVQEPRRGLRPWMVGAAAFAVVLIAALPMILRPTSSLSQPSLDGIAAMPGIDSATPLASGGLQGMASDGEDMWVMTTLQNQLQRISASGDILATYQVDARVEGVVAGGDHLWLLTPDDGGAAMRFDPDSGVVDLTVPLGGVPGWARWFGDALWVSNEQGQLLQISSSGEVLSTRSGELKGGEGLGYLWVNDPETGLLSSLDEEGNLGEVVVPTTGEEPGTMAGAGVRQVAEADGRLFLLDGDYPWGTNLSVFDPASGDVSPFTALTFGLLDMTEWEGSLWVTSHTDFLLLRIDPVTAEVTRYPMPGKVAGLDTTDDGLWATLYHPGALVHLDPENLVESAPVTYDTWDRFPHRLLCTGESAPGTPTVVFEPYDWLDYGSWSVIQARISAAGYRACANGYVEGEATPEQRASDLEEALNDGEITGPYVLVATGDGVHATRLFAGGRDDIAGVVLVDPVPVGYESLVDSLIPPDDGPPPIADITTEVSDSLAGFGGTPLTVIGQEPDLLLNPNFVATYGSETAETLNSAWQDGLEFYAGLSTNSRSVVAEGTFGYMVIWDQPDLVVDEITAVLEVAEAS